jgi:NADPH:quinone reductase-like Zn-dependent oxidoreductase
MLCLRCKVVGEHVDGCFAEFVCVDADMLFAIDDGLACETAAALPTAYLTAWRMLMTQAHIGPGETVLVHGVGGGVALASLQLALLAGGIVIVSSGDDAKLTRAEALGAHAALNYKRDDAVAAVMEFSGGRGVDIVIDNVGAATWPVSLRAVRRGGRIVTCGATSGGHPSADLQRLFIRQIQVSGSTLGNHDEFRALLAVAARGQLAPVIDRIYDFADAAQALERLEKARQFGKLVLKVG